jgi:hypothetical protein
MKYYFTKSGYIVDENNVVIPQEENNTDYQKYLDWLNNGGTVEPTDFDIEQIEVPVSVPLWCVKVVLHEMGLIEQVQTALSQLPEPDRTRASYIWEYGNIIQRNSPTVAFVGQVLQLDSKQMNFLFITADSINL